MGHSTKTLANCSKITEPNGSELSSDEGTKRACSPLKDKIGQYGYGEDIPRPVDKSKYKGLDNIFRRGKVLAIVKDDGIFQVHTDVRLDADFWYFESKKDMTLWNAAIFAEAAFTRAKIKRKRENEAQQEQLENQSIFSLKDQFQAERKRVANFCTIDDMKVAQDIKATFERITKVDAEKAYMLNYHLNPIQREKLFEEISSSGVNMIFPVPKVEPALPEEKKGLARCALEFAVAANYDLASMIEDIARNKSDKLVGKIINVWQDSLVFMGDAQTELES
ncbi:MAG: hypothetical protein EZS28_011605 [Streblomastix strix]|uniref:Uncharacterized protein n=1 Tax=Streblomastix strix TaxID=222440 RepID=A0A5J4WD22_9EUKA|nr:MAG: hypothetical protein EZS28_011605 [Streblomastix strix]